jgi:ribosome-associated protein
VRKMTGIKNDSASNDEDIEYVSKSEMKRHVAALQKVGKQLCELNYSQYQQFNLPDVLDKAISEYKRIQSLEAKRRQLQYIGKLMRHVDAEHIEKQLFLLNKQHKVSTQEFQKIEKTRDQLLEFSNDELYQFSQANPNLDLQKLRALIRQTKKEQQLQKPPKFYRQLFQLLKENLEQ